MTWSLRCCLTLFICSCSLPALFGQDAPFSSVDVSGQPYLPPEESVRRFQVPPGFEVKLFAAEPDVINPIAFTIDERGRVWVVESFEYPNRTPPGKKPRDRIKILEDTTGNGMADKVTVWAEGKDFEVGFDMASGIEIGHGGVFLGAAPHLFFLSDTTGAGKCNKQEILLSGFGSEDTHEILNTFQWGPEGFLYGLHGCFTNSKVGDTHFDAGVWRYQVAGHKFDVFADGTSNPWGLDFDCHGEAFMAACVIPHAYHMIQGGTYIRQAGTSYNRYAYGQLKEISDHFHYQESGWAHAGALILQGDSIPEEYQGHMLMGSIHGASIKRDILEERGSTYVAKHAPDFMVSGDKNFRPINMRWGPDGSIYIIDWHDQNYCHQSDPNSWDQTHGRIYKIQRTSAKQIPAVDLAKKSSPELVELLKNNNPWWFRTALRLLNERKDRSVAPLLLDLVFKSKDEIHGLRGLWGLYAIGAFDDALAERTLQHASPWVRSWAVRLIGESGQASEAILQHLAALATQEQIPQVRCQLASTAIQLREQNVLPVLHNLLAHKEDSSDQCLPLMDWIAYEPQVAKQPDAVLNWLKHHAAGNDLVSNEILPRAMRRLVASDNPEDLAKCISFLGDANDSAIRLRALEGLTKALENQEIDPPANWQHVFASLLQDEKDVRQLARQLAISFRDFEAIERSLGIARDETQPVHQRVQAIRNLANAHPQDALLLLEVLVARDHNLEVRCEACRALTKFVDGEIPARILENWHEYPQALRIEAVSLLAGRKDWASELLKAVENGRVARGDLTNNTILRMDAFQNEEINNLITAVWGQVSPPTSELNEFIDKMRTALHEGRGSYERGRQVFETRCSKCHKFEGVGHEVGPNLDGAARDIEYLLINVLDPNRVVGQPYFTWLVELNNGRLETGLLAAENDQTVTLKSENDVLKVISKKDISEKTKQTKSVMPLGLFTDKEQQEFRDLIRYVMVNPFLTDVQVAGPYSEADKTILVNSKNPAYVEGATWIPVASSVTGKLLCPPRKTAGEVVSYIRADIIAPEAMHTKLMLGASEIEVRVWINRTPVYEGTPAQGAPVAPDQTSADVELKEGINQVLLQVKYLNDPSIVYARFLDPNRKLRYPEVK